MKLKRWKSLSIPILVIIFLFNIVYAEGETCRPGSNPCGGELVCCVQKGASMGSTGICRKTCNSNEAGDNGSSGTVIGNYDGTEARYIAAVLWDFSGVQMQYDVYPNNDTSMKKYQNAYCGSNNYPNTTGSGDTADCSSTNVEDNNNQLLVWPGIYEYRNEPLTQKDLSQANVTISTLVTDLNSAISYVITNGNDASLPSKTVNEIAWGIVSALPNGSYAGVNFTQGNPDFKDTAYGNTPKQGIGQSNFVILSSDSTKEKAVLIWKMPKGYASGQYAVKDGVGAVNNPQWIEWKDLVKMANAAYAAGNTADTSAEGKGFQAFYTGSELGKYVTEFSKTEFLGMSAERLGLQTIEDLILNRNSRKYAYYLGMMPYQWWNVANGLFWIFEIIGVFILISAILYTVYKQNYAIISPIERLSIQDHIANILIAIFFMAIYVPVFYVISKTNSIMVETLNSFTNGEVLVEAKTATMSSGGAFGMMFWGIGMKSIGFFIIVRMNIMYLSRAITITALHIIAPAAIASMSYTGRQRGTLFSTWFRELVAAILMQAFDAVILTLYIIITNHASGMNSLESQLLCFTLIPLNTFFREKITGTSGVMGVANEAFQNTKGAMDKSAWISGRVAGAAINTAKNLVRTIPGVGTAAGAALDIVGSGLQNGIEGATNDSGGGEQVGQNNGPARDGNGSSGQKSEEAVGMAQSDPTITKESITSQRTGRQPSHNYLLDTAWVLLGGMADTALVGSGYLDSSPGLSDIGVTTYLNAKDAERKYSQNRPVQPSPPTPRRKNGASDTLKKDREEEERKIQEEQEKLIDE